MKKYILIFFVTFCAAPFAYAQDTINPTTGFQSFFGRESTEWNGVVSYYYIPWEDQLLRVAGDTIINDLVYKKVDCNKVFWNNGNIEIRDAVFDFYLREDTATGKLWCRYPDEDEDFLIMDMSLSIGDAIVLRCYLCDPYSVSDYLEDTYVVVDTATIDGVYTITIEIEFYNRIKFMEGVGCSNLFDYSRYYDVIASSDLVCCHRDGQLVYYNNFFSNLGYEDCVYHPVGIEESERNARVTISPNPCIDWVRIEGEQIQALYLYDAKGICVKSQHGENNQLTMSDLPSGYYILQILSNNQISYRTIIKK